MARKKKKKCISKYKHNEELDQGIYENAKSKRRIQLTNQTSFQLWSSRLIKLPNQNGRTFHKVNCIPTKYTKKK